MQHENFHPLPSGNGMDGGGTRITRCRTDNRQRGVGAGQETLKQLAQQLQRHILERQGRAVEQFQQPMLFVQLHQRCHGIMGKTAIGGST